MVHLLNTPMISNPLFVQTTQTITILQPALVPKSNDDSPFKVQHGLGYTPEVALKILGSYHHTHQYSSPVEVEKTIGNEDHEEMARKMKSLEQSVRDMQGLEGHKMSYLVIYECFLTFICPLVLKL